jgi:Txe/YoeB family toxin of Txe-Axe toxin-antitoxin module
MKLVWSESAWEDYLWWQDDEISIAAARYHYGK